ncbi:MAG TPA: metallophosphoesterase family protein [Bryobacteraceae bacterium]|nr:metallophosphoesterase family protein [Bryobacteraceae bacterium]
MLTALRYLILSDIHSNRTALDAVLTAADGLYDVAVSCGDVVGYGPEPNEAVECCRQRCRSVVRGNHDKACSGLLDLEWFNSVAQVSAEWTAAVLSPENLSWIRHLPEGPLELEDFSLMHGSPRDEDEYVLHPAEVEEIAPYLTQGVAFFGHTHIQTAYEVHRNGVRVLREQIIELADTSAYLINPGSVGQPRDRDARAGWAIYDTKERIVDLRRTEYNVQQVHDRIREVGLPEVLGLRLHSGM